MRIYEFKSKQTRDFHELNMTKYTKYFKKEIDIRLLFISNPVVTLQYYLPQCRISLELGEAPK